MTPIIVDNLLPAGYADDIEQDLTQTGFDWFYVKDVTNANYGNNSGFVHPAYDYGKSPSTWFPYIKPFTYSIEQTLDRKIEELYRIRVGFLYPSPNINQFNTPHVDFLWPHLTACYYVSNTDGDTVIFDQHLSEVGSDINNESLKLYTEKTKFTIKTSVNPVKNRLIIFDGLNFHASTKPKHHDTRLVITVNFK
tara:strand:+ start:1922 stop:2503 length:582 start_codon:yes stop_codon:yes gene_type:complete